ncbi:hypothetical protein [Labilibacter marinus]|uniref:hypothetical protein n=1 Tax=Labilibacter marinus TaxID=1477105 RepID=UPI000834A92D|nr:hypothetical protein [Labilibacter marinus]
MKVNNVFKTMAMLLAVTLFVSCSDDDDKKDEGPDEIMITQAQLNAATNMLATETGGTFAHGGPDGTTGSETVRKIYSSVTDLDGTIAPGTIVTKKTYALDGEGNMGNLYVSFAMVKREPGYDTANKDWEYMKIGFDADNDYDANPFGMLPAEGSADRGKLAGCIGCHTGAGGGDFLFVN